MNVTYALYCREVTESYTLYILANVNPDLHISEEERAAFSIKSLERDVTVAKVKITVLDVNDNEPVFERPVKISIYSLAE